MSRIKEILVIPSGWSKYGDAVYKLTAGGLCVLLTVEEYLENNSDTPPMGIGEYVHISLSRKDIYPSWDEMKDFIYSCEFFDHKRDVVMLLPPPEEYVNVHKNCFHFYQKKV